MAIIARKSLFWVLATAGFIFVVGLEYFPLLAATVNCTGNFTVAVSSNPVPTGTQLTYTVNATGGGSTISNLTITTGTPSATTFSSYTTGQLTSCLGSAGFTSFACGPNNITSAGTLFSFIVNVPLSAYGSTLNNSFTIGGTWGADTCTGTRNVSVSTSCPTVGLSPTTLPTATAGTSYSQNLSGTNGVSPFTFSVTSGTLPAGLHLSGAGVLSGTPTTVGNTSFTISANDANTCPGSQAYTLTTIASVPALPPLALALAFAVLLAAGYIGLRHRTARR